MSELGAPLQLRCGATLPNRVAKAAMTEAMAGIHAIPSEALHTLYRRWGEGGAGMLITGNVMVDRRYLERLGNVVFDERTPLLAVRKWANATKVGGAKGVVQLSHPGRQCNRFVHPKPVAPSAGQRVKLLGFFTKPRELTASEIQEVIERFAGAAQLAERAGFDGVQVHAAHGYLLSQFLSPLTNQRDDEWGGDLERRAKMVRACVEAVKDATGEKFIVGVKLNSSDFQRGGFDHEDSLRVAKWLDEDGVDFIEVSGGNYESTAFLGADGSGTLSQGTRDREAYFKVYAKEIADAVDAPIMLTGGLRTARVMREILDEGAADIIGLGRPFVTDPEIAQRLLGDDEAAAPSEAPPMPPSIFKPMLSVGEAAWYGELMKAMGRGEQPNFGAGWLGPTMAYLNQEVFASLKRRLTTDIAGAPAPMEVHS
ncbi:MAG: NADH:flavin oxidoreductase/NADH oxidase family protein [Myxococcota bacterium]